MTQDEELKVYRAFVRAKAKGTPIGKAVKPFGISRQTAYDIVKRIEGGDFAKMNKCVAQGKLECMWKYKYERRFSVIKEGRTAVSVAARKALMREMAEDGFPQTDIARRLGELRGTVIHHLKS